MSFTQNLRPSRKYVLGIDVGGTKTQYGVYEIEDGHMNSKFTIRDRETTELGSEKHPAQIAQMIGAIKQKIADDYRGELVGVGVASPGRFGSDGVIKPGTNSFVGVEGINLQQAYEQELEKTGISDIPVFVGNDAEAMLAGMIEQISGGYDFRCSKGEEINRKLLAGQTVGLLTVSTGVGSSYIECDENGSYCDSDGKIHFVTDGHACKLWLEVDDEDRPMFEKIKAQLQRQMEARGDTGNATVSKEEDGKLFVRAEDLFRGPAVAAMAGVEDGGEVDVKNPDHQAALAFAGKYMARTIELVRNQAGKDIVAADEWSEEEKAQAAKASLYLIGGGMGRSPEGSVIIEHANEELKMRGIDDVRIAQFPRATGVERAAASLVPANLYQKEKTIMNKPENAQTTIYEFRPGQDKESEFGVLVESGKLPGYAENTVPRLFDKKSELQGPFDSYKEAQEKSRELANFGSTVTRISDHKTFDEAKAALAQQEAGQKRGR